MRTSVCLINLPHFFCKPEPKPHAPLGLLCLRAALEEKHEARILDLGFHAWREYRSEVLLPLPELRRVVVTALEEHQPAIAAFASPNFVALTGVLLVARYYKKRNPHSLVVVGGNAASACHLDILQKPNGVDVVVRGEGEETFRELVDSVLAGRDWQHIHGLSLQRRGTVQVNPDRPLITNLDNLPLLDYNHPFSVDEYQRNNSSEFKSVYIETGRGCPFRCSFCSTNQFWARSYRTKSAARIVSEMVHYFETFGVSHFELVQDQFCLGKERILAFCEELEQSANGLSWGCESRSGTIDATVIEKMAQAGCRKIKMGIESGSSRILKRIDKDLELSNTEEVVRAGVANGLSMECSFIIGFPFEEREDVDQTLRFANRLRCLGSVVYINALHPHANAPITREYENVLHPRKHIPEPIRRFYHSDLAPLIENNRRMLPDYLSLSNDCIEERIARMLAYDFLTGDDQLFNSLLASYPYSLLRLTQLHEDSPVAFVEAFDRFAKEVDMDLAELGTDDSRWLFSRFVAEGIQPDVREEIRFLLESETDTELAQVFYLGDDYEVSNAEVLYEYLSGMLSQSHGYKNPSKDKR